MIGKKLKELRTKKDVSQTEIAKHLGVAQTTYSQYELDQRDISTEMLIKLALYHSITTDQLLGLDEAKTIERYNTTFGLGEDDILTDTEYQAAMDFIKLLRKNKKID